MTVIRQLPLAPNRPDPDGVVPFDLAGPLPSGVTLLEASAGTGKTFAIAALATRFIAAGTPLEQLLVVTFTRAATGELRERVRDRLVRTADGLDRFLSSSAVDDRDEVLMCLTEGDRSEVVARRDHVSGAVAAFDAATIDTTHGFCYHVLSGLGVSGDVDLRARLVEDVTDLVNEVVDDLYIRKFWHSAEDPAFTREQAMQIAHKVLYNPGAVIVPTPEPGGDNSMMRARLASVVVTETDMRKRAAGVLTYDDLLTRLRDTLEDKRRGPAARQKLRDRYRVVLVDEFQDTDVVQWEILKRAFVSQQSTLVLIGDPKQSIYAFRGADVYSYLAAADQATCRHTLNVNWRSDEGLLRAFDALFANAKLGDPRIAYRQVDAAPPHHVARLVDAAHPEPLRIRVLDRRAAGPSSGKYPSAPIARDVIARDLAADVVELLSSRAALITRRQDGSDAGREPVRPGHLAVLVRTTTSAATVQAALQAAGVPCVIAGAGSVFESAAGQHWLRLLEAVERPTRRDKATAATLTPFIGWDADRVAMADEESWEIIHVLLHRWSSLLRRRGAAALLEDVSATQRLPERVLSMTGGERLLTDIRHIGQLLHQQSMAESLGSAALVGWLGRRMTEKRNENDDPDRSVRLESDAESVQILTIHRSKGLEFPIVYCPYAWDHYEFKIDIPVFHDADNGNVRSVDVSLPSVAHRGHADTETRELRGEDLRLLYVALTRARHQVVMWWAGSKLGNHSAFSRLMFARELDGSVAESGRPNPDDLVAVDTFRALVAASGGNVSVEMTDQVVSSATWSVRKPPPPHLDACTFARTLDVAWRRSSFSGITAGTYSEQLWNEQLSEQVGSEPLSDTIGDEAPAADSQAIAAPVVADPPSESKLRSGLPLSAMRSGADVGTLIHNVLEAIDFTSPDLGPELREAIIAESALRQVEIGDADLIVGGVTAALESSLGPLCPTLRLRDIGKVDRLDEMSFELPLVGGDDVAGVLTLDAIAGLLRSLLPAGDPVRMYADRLGNSALQADLRGFLTGSLDLVFRTRAAENSGPSKYFVADYKTNRLAAEATLLTPWHYRPEALQAEMLHAHYPLQGLLYLVALHRYLRWRVRGYDPAVNLGGVLYLFLRGMSPLTPRFGDDVCGVWSWHPPAALVEALSDVFDLGVGPQ